uniref:Uncharacterized protein n=1 Tax=uncultured marine group II/III euryarchaeote AD1000_70_A08 TaxID=1457803 RepID=A0A075G226_9EURY|nr:hypothetical protein [uncultured marine group II/III euryarchaeote AD1000_70_A08]
MALPRAPNVMIQITSRFYQKVACPRLVSMSEEDNGNIGRIWIRVGSTEVDLTGSAREVNDSWLKLKEQDTWASALSKIRTARQDAIEAARQSISETGIPERGSAFRRLLENCNVYRTGDVILAAIHYLRSVEKEHDTPPRAVKRLIGDSGRWTDAELEKWNLSLYINRMLDDSSSRGRPALLAYPAGKEKNRYVVVTDAGRDHLERLSS